MKHRKFGLFIVFVLLLVGAFAPARAQDIPPKPASGYILDQLDWLTPLQETQLNDTLHKLDTDTTNQIGIATISNCGSDTTGFRTQLFRAWGIGQKDKNNGLLILFCINQSTGRPVLEQEVGYGLEGDITDLATAHAAQEFVVPAFKGRDIPTVVGSGDAAKAIVALVGYYDGLLRGTIQAPVAQVAPPSAEAQIVAFIYSITPVGWAVLCIFGLLILFILWKSGILSAIMDGIAESDFSSGGYYGGSSSSGSSDGGSSGGGFGGGSSGGGGSSTPL